MSLVTAGDWRACVATRQAAAMAALGVRIAPIAFFRVREGDEKITYQHDPESVLPHFQPFVGRIKQCLNDFAAGDLQANTPLHPFCDAMRAIGNAEMIRDAHSERDAVFGLGYDAGRQRTRLTRGAAMPLAGPYAKCRSLARSAALATLGFPLLSREQADDQTTRYVHPRLSVPMIANDAPVIYDAAELLGAEREGTLSPLHPFAIACAAARVWLQLLDILEHEHRVIMFRGSGTRSAFVPADASQQMLDRAEGYAAGTQPFLLIAH